MRGLQTRRIRIKIVIENNPLSGCWTVNPDPIRQPKNRGFDEAQEQGQDNDSRGHESQCRYLKTIGKPQNEGSHHTSYFKRRKLGTKNFRDCEIWGIGLSENNEDAYNPDKWMGLNLLEKVHTDVRTHMSTVKDDYG
jgi:hypothetical protein